MVRASVRTHEFAVRAALGASAGRLRAQTMGEVLPLGVLGAGGGVLFAWLLLKVLVPLLPPQLPGVESIGLHGLVLTLAVVLSILVVLLVGMLPSRLASRVQLSGSLQHSSRTVAGGGMTRNLLVGVQIAVTLVLVFAGGLLVRSLVAVMMVNPGYSTEDVLTMELTVPREKYSTSAQIVDYYRRLIARAKTLPAVKDAGFINLLPLTEGGLVGPVEFENNLDGGQIGVNGRSVTPGYISTMGIPLIRGRNFTEDDKENTPKVGLIDEQLAVIVFGNADPIGKRFRFGAKNSVRLWVEVIGVISHVRSESLDADVRPQIYWPESQQTQERGALVIKTSGSPASIASAVVNQIHSENPDQLIYDVRPMNELVDQNLQSRKLLTGLVALFGASSLLLACLGLYGVVSYSTGLRLREFAIRTALGAQPRDVRRLVFVYALRIAIAGSIVGLIAAWPAGRALRTVLYGVGSADTVALSLAPILILLIAFLAVLGPARRAGRVDPAVILRD